jgi:hypothetical protein
LKFFSLRQVSVLNAIPKPGTPDIARPKKTSPRFASEKALEETSGTFS